MHATPYDPAGPVESHLLRSLLNVLRRSSVDFCNVEYIVIRPYHFAISGLNSLRRRGPSYGLHGSLSTLNIFSRAFSTSWARKLLLWYHPSVAPLLPMAHGTSFLNILKTRYRCLVRAYLIETCIHEYFHTHFSSLYKKRQALPDAPTFQKLPTFLTKTSHQNNLQKCWHFCVVGCKTGTSLHLFKWFSTFLLRKAIF